MVCPFFWRDPYFRDAADALLFAPTDPFDYLESDPLATSAPDSSLWELATLRHHYSASVSGLAKIFAEVMGRQSYAMEDFLDHSYGTVRHFLSTSCSRSSAGTNEEYIFLIDV